KHAVPRTVAWHLVQLEPFVSQRLLGAPEFVQAVARGTAEACEMRPQVGLPIVEQWWAAARSDRRHGSPSGPARRGVPPGLAAVAVTYGYIRSSGGPARRAPPVLVGHLRSILNEEGHPFVRRHALTAFAIQTQSDLALADRVLPDLLTRARLADRPQLLAL